MPSSPGWALGNGLPWESVWSWPHHDLGDPRHLTYRHWVQCNLVWVCGSMSLWALGCEDKPHTSRWQKHPMRACPLLLVSIYFSTLLMWLFYFLPIALLWLVRHYFCTNKSFVTEISISSVQSLSRVRLFAIPWIAARQASLSITISRSSLKLNSIELVMPPSHLILCRPLFLLPPIPPSIRVFSNESILCMRWPK